MDNDEKGRMFDQKISDKLFEKGIASKILVPTRKDWNEDLTNRQPTEQTEEASETETEEAELCPALQP